MLVFSPPLSRRRNKSGCWKLAERHNEIVEWGRVELNTNCFSCQTRKKLLFALLSLLRRKNWQKLSFASKKVRIAIITL